MMERRTLLMTGCAVPLALATRGFAGARAPVIGGPCEGCDWVFDGLPAKPASAARIAPAAQAGRPLVIEGIVTTLAGATAAGTIVYAYHTDDTGIYPRAGNRHGTLRGWAVTDAQGRYRFDTIRPRAYPSGGIPEHVHMHVIESTRGTYWIDDIRFTGALPKTRSGKIMRRLLRDIASGKETIGDTTTLEDYSVLAKLRDDE